MLSASILFFSLSSAPPPRLNEQNDSTLGKRPSILRNLDALEIVPNPDKSGEYDEVVESVRKILTSKNSLEKKNLREEIENVGLRMKEFNETRPDGPSEFFTKLSYNGGVENNLSRKEEIVRNNKIKILGRNRHGSVFEDIFSEEPDDEERIEENSRSTSVNASRDEQDKFEPREDDILEAANFGLQAMHELYFVKEPKLYSMGLYLEADNPARYVAAFNGQTEQARNLAKYGYAILEGTSMFIKKYPDFATDVPASRNRNPLDRNPLQRQCPQRGTPRCPPASLRYRTSDGSCNNLKNLWWGSAMSMMQRFLPPIYQDGIQSIRRSKNGRPLPSAREISNLIHRDHDVPLASVTHMLMQWGQFVDHDITATGQSRGFNGTIPQCCLRAGAGFQPPEFTHPECLAIPVGPRDDFYGPMGVRCLEFIRSGVAPREDCEFGPREQLTQVTSYVDASTVYSSDAAQSDGLRIFRNGLLQYGRIQSRRPLLPRQDSDLCKRGSLSTSCFRAGDGRVSEQPALTSLHIVFLRLHNRIATKLAALNPHWSDEKLFQESRRIVGALVQHITYREFLPIVLGHEVMKIFDLEILKKDYYERYDATVNPTIANAFTTAAYRFGHSLVQHSFVRYDSQHRPIFNNVSIHDEFSNPINLETPGSVDRLLLGLVNQPSQKRDEFISDELTKHLFQTPRFPFGMDLASLNIQRGRDHGLPPYVKWREPCGLSPIRTFEDFERATSPAAAVRFRSVYSSVEDIDLYPAGLAEKSVVGGLVGPTFACIIAQQFGNLRRGDRFWYENSGNENSFTRGQLQQIRRVTLAQVLCQTMENIETIQPFVFLLPDTVKNQRIGCHDQLIGAINLELWAERPAGFRGDRNAARKEKRKTNNRLKPPNSSTPFPKTEFDEDRINDGEKIALLQRQKPAKVGIRQQNRIVVKRPLGSPDNFTIVVQNNAVNSPVFVNDAIYGSNIRLHSHPTTPRYERPNLNIRESIRRPVSPSIPLGLYFPHSFEDPSNPNPLNYDFGLGNPANYASDVVFDSVGTSGTRLPLYTYYANSEKNPTTPSFNRHQYNYSGNRKQEQPGSPSGGYSWSNLPRPTKKPTQDSFHTASSEYNDYTSWNNPNNKPNEESDAYFHDSDNPNAGQSQPLNYPGVNKPVPVQSYSDDRSYSEDCHSEEVPTNLQQSSTTSGAVDRFSYLGQGEFDRFGGISIPKPIESHTETVEIVPGPSNHGYRAQKIENEVPTPLNSQKSARQMIWKSGQYYYKENVLRRYPDNLDDGTQKRSGCATREISDKNKKKTVFPPSNLFYSESSYVDSNSNAHVIRNNDEDKIVTTPTIVFSNENDKNEDNEDYDLEGAFSENVKRIIPPVGTSRVNNDWVNPAEDSGLSSLLEMPELTGNDSSSALELPKPMKLRTSGL